MNGKGNLLVKFLIDIGSWFSAVFLAAILRFDGNLPNEIFMEVIYLGIFAISLSLLFGIIFSLYAGKYRTSSFEEFLVLSLSTLLVTGILLLIRIVFEFPVVPRSVPIISGAIALIIMLAGRVLTSPQLLNRSTERSSGERTLIYGAGIVGRQLAEQMIVLSGQYNPIGFVDDDIAKSNLSIYGRKVLGNIDQLEYIVESKNPTVLIVAISGIESSSLLDLERRCRSLGIKLRIIPTVHEIISGAVRLGDIEDISEEDLLGRHTVAYDDANISEFINGKKVLITGAGGSIGSEIARQIHRYGPKKLTMLDRDETALLNLQLSLDGTGLLTNGDLVLADIRDKARIKEIFDTVNPEVVFHAAALKHLMTLERYPEEAFKTNVIGTANVLEAAQEVGVMVFVNISTDKAADPSSELGKSKLLTEKLTAKVKQPRKKYISVRFGNVIGSNGSFLHTFRYQIKHGGPLTVTHPEVTRFFMTVSEAVHLVLHSMLIGEDGETLILDMGKPISINAIAKHMIEVSGRSIEIRYTGLRPGEKLHESLVSPNEDVVVREHPFIMHTKVDTTIDENLIYGK
ncbi:COG1086 Predicted nucleoside-diphosphate sugar epimerases [actinobacterium SCGC AAA044-D11]